MKIPVLTVDAPNANGRIYPRKLIESELDRLQDNIKNGRLFVYGGPENASLTNIIGVVNSTILQDDTVTIEINFLEKGIKEGLIMGLQSGELKIRSAGVGSLTHREDGTFVINDDYQLTGFFITDKAA